MSDNLEDTSTEFQNFSSDDSITQMTRRFMDNSSSELCYEESEEEAPEKEASIRIENITIKEDNLKKDQQYYENEKHNVEHHNLGKRNTDKRYHEDEYYNEHEFYNSKDEQYNEDEQSNQDEQECDEGKDENNFQKRLEAVKQQFEERFKNLHETMIVLKRQLSEEKDLWKKELQEASQPIYVATVTPIVQILPPPVSPPVAPSQLQPAVTEFELQENRQSSYISQAEYQDKISQYEEAILKAHAEKRAQLKRHISISNYKRRLLEVENMCNLELLRVKQSVQYLQPLQAMASEWKLKSRNNFSTMEEDPRKEIDSKMTSFNSNKSSGLWSTDHDSTHSTDYPDSSTLKIL